jgi:predicted transcriptional regulator
MLFMVLNLTLFRYVTGEVSTIVMKADVEAVELRVKLESVETLLQDSRIGKDLQDEIREHFRTTQSSTGVDQTAIFRWLACI